VHVVVQALIHQLVELIVHRGLATGHLPVLRGEERLSNRLALRRKGLELVESLRAVIDRKAEAERMLEIDTEQLKRLTKALRNAQALRSQGQAVRDAVDGVRSAIIRRVFNNQLNRVWRDLFVRLAPSEPFVPAFRIPEAETRQLQPKLITVDRDTGELGGTPGAMLSAGNLNTAALTLFIALHLSVSEVLPWLILDDPVQSMDDVHIAHFAALLRTSLRNTAGKSSSLCTTVNFLSI